MKRNRIDAKALFVVSAALIVGIAPPAPMTAQSASPTPLPIIFVHGNGDDAAKWVPTMWLFESNGYPANRLYAVRFPNPLGRTDDTVAEPFRSSTTEEADVLSKYVDRVLRETHGDKVVLVGSSRGGLTIRNYLQQQSDRHTVAAAILCGTPNHGVLVSDTNPNGEFNGGGTFLTKLNKPGPDGLEVPAGVRMLTLRSDRLDKFAQPLGAALGMPTTATGVTFEGPALKGATNVVLNGEDHRELAFSRPAFAAMYKFLTGAPPKTVEVTAEAHPSLSGLVTGYAGPSPTNEPLAGVHLAIYAITGSAEAKRKPVYEKVIGEDGAWGPLTALPGVEYEFQLVGNDSSAGKTGSAADLRTVRLYMTHLQRSSNLLNLRFLPAPAATTPKGGAAVLVDRPQGYFSRERDPVTLDGKSIAEEPAGLPLRDAFLAVAPTTNEVEITLRGERLRVQPSTDLGHDLPVAYFLW